MDNPTVSWEIRDENDRIISVLAWVVVVVLVLYAVLFLYRHVLAPTPRTPVASAPPAAGTRPSVAAVRVRTGSGPPAPPVRPVQPGSAVVVPGSKEVVPAGVSNDPARRHPMAVRASLYEGPREAFEAIRNLDFGDHAVSIVRKGRGYALQTGPIQRYQEIEALTRRLRRLGAKVEVIPWLSGREASPGPTPRRSATAGKRARHPGERRPRPSKPAPPARRLAR